MAIVEVNFHSTCLNRMVTYKAIIPSEVDVEPGQKVKIDLKRFFVFDKEGKRLI